MQAVPIFINGKDYPVKYGFAALRHFSDVTGITIGELGKLGEDITMTQAIALVWAGLKDGARVQKISFDLTLDDVADILDEDQAAMEKVIAVFSKSLSSNKANVGKKKAK